MVIIHHSKDLDGFSSGAICKLKYPEARLIGWDYADPLPDFEQFRGEDVIMIDITFPIDKLIELGRMCKLTVIDHHISFFKDYVAKTPDNENNPLKGNPESITRTQSLVAEVPFLYIYQAKKAACEIGWNFLFTNKQVPKAITLLGRYDTWRQGEGDWEGETLPFQYAMRTECTSAESFPILKYLDLSTEDENIKTAVEIGKSILKYQEQQDEMACLRSSFEATISGLRAICLNTRFFSSNTVKSVYNPDKHDIMVGFEYTGKKWTVSLRSSKPEVDCSIIAKSRGGGGHKAAAGFEASSFEKIFS